jgi:hypothetical protein
VVRYDHGERPVPPVVFDRLYGLPIKRHAEVGRLLHKLSAAREEVV